MAALEEKVLVQKALEGDVDAFESLVTTHEKSVYNLAFRMVSDREDAMDIVQEVFIKAYHALPSFRGESRFSTWVYRVCVNTCLDYLRKKQKSTWFSLDQPVTSKDSVFQREVEDLAEDVQQEVEQKLLGEEIINILEELDPGYRALIVLCDIQGYSYQEISDILNLSLGTVKSRLHRARNMIRRLLPSEHFSTSFVKKGERREAL